MSERCGRKSKQMSEWPSIYIWILPCSGPCCTLSFTYFPTLFIFLFIIVSHPSFPLPLFFQKDHTKFFLCISSTLSPFSLSLLSYNSPTVLHLHASPFLRLHPLPFTHLSSFYLPYTPQTPTPPTTYNAISSRFFLLFSHPCSVFSPSLLNCPHPFYLYIFSYLSLNFSSSSFHVCVRSFLHPFLTFHTPSISIFFHFSPSPFLPPLFTSVFGLFSIPS